MLPHFPEEVLKDWLFLHGKHALFVDGTLDLFSLAFRKERWPTSRIIHDVGSWRESTVNAWRCAIVESFHREGPLGSFMIEHGTWPVPPLVFDNDSGLKTNSGSEMFRYHLIDGHHRIGYLHGLASSDSDCLKTDHDLWLAR